VTGTGAPWLLYANGAGTTTITIAGTVYTVTAGSTVGTSAYTGSQSVTISSLPTFTPSTAVWTSSNAYTSVQNGKVNYCNNKFFLPPFGSTTYLTSSDGVTWTSNTFPASVVIYSFIYGVIGGTGYYLAPISNFVSTSFYYSTNGTSWTATTNPQAGNYQGVAFGNSTFVATGTNGITNIYSTNGTTWSTMSMPSSSAWQSVTFGNGYFVSVAPGNTAGTKGAYSTNGYTWTASTLGFSQTWNSVAYGNVNGTTPTFVALGDSTNAYNLANYSTNNGSTWTNSTVPSSNNYTSVTYGNGYFVAVNFTNTTWIYSANGITWTQSSSSTSNYNNVAYGNGIFVENTSAGASTTTKYIGSPATINAYGIYNGATVRA
jgi:hypothetical protein